MSTCFEKEKSIRVDRFEGREYFDRLRPEWDHLWKVCPESTESQSWQWQRLYSMHISPRLRPIFIVARDHAGALLALGIFAVRRNRATFANQLEFLGEHDADYHLILRRPELPVETGSRMFARLLAKSNGASVAEFCNIPTDSWTITALNQFMTTDGSWKGPVRTRLSDTYRLPLPSTMDEYWRTFSKKTRDRLKNKMRGLHRNFRVEFRVPSTEIEFEEGLKRAEGVHRLRWGASSKFNNCREAEFFRESARALFREGTCRLFLLEINGDCAAFNLGMILGKRICFPYVTHNPFVGGNYSVGLLVNLMVVEHCIGAGFESYDLTRGSEPYKALLGAGPVHNSSVILFRSQAAALLSGTMGRMTPFLRRVKNGELFQSETPGKVTKIVEPDSPASEIRMSDDVMKQDDCEDRT
jgi:CelD/BcsL family acetyltransferase involved in cellulose biosynthesis